MYFRLSTVCIVLLVAPLSALAQEAKGEIAVTVFTREEIETSGATTIPDLLRLVPGMDVAVASPFYASVSSRLPWTDEGNRYLVLLDGRPVNWEYLGLVPWAILPLNLDNVERIEVLRGPYSSVYGAGAMAGVIIITTRPIPEGTQTLVGIAGGELGSLSIGLRGAAQMGNLGISVWGGGSRMNSFEHPDVRGSRSASFRAMAHISLGDEQRLLAEVAYSNGKGDLATQTDMYNSGTLSQVAVRMGYESRNIQGYFSFNSTPIDIDTLALPPLTFSGIRLAVQEVPETLELSASNMLADFRWSLPELTEQLAITIGAQFRSFWFGTQCTSCLDPETYADITSPSYHLPGIDVDESQFGIGTYAHVAWTPLDWLAAAASVRIDADSATDMFVSARVAATVMPFDGQSFRAGMGRGYRRTAYAETGLSLIFLASFPPDSPITGPSQERFQEFLTRTGRVPHMGNDSVLSLEAGYLGQFFDKKLSLSVDFYFSSLYLNRWIQVPQIVVDEQGLPDLDSSSFDTFDDSRTVNTIGTEVTLSYHPTPDIALLAIWTHREVFDENVPNGKGEFESPFLSVVFGGRFNTSVGLLGSFYTIIRSPFGRTPMVSQGMLEPNVMAHIDLDGAVLFLGRLGFRLPSWKSLELELGMKLFWPVIPIGGDWYPHYPESLNGEELSRTILCYLQGSF